MRAGLEAGGGIASVKGNRYHYYSGISAMPKTPVGGVLPSGGMADTLLNVRQHPRL